jgi:hypothetical protein
MKSPIAKLLKPPAPYIWRFDNCGARGLFQRETDFMIEELAEIYRAYLDVSVGKDGDALGDP